MEQLNALCERFSGTSISGQWRDLLDLYTRIELETDAFRQAFAVHCPDGCGTCCEHFVPDLSTLEASLVAAYLLFVKQDADAERRLVESMENPGTSCPLYNPDSPFHCTVYPVRGMICRLFGACPSEDKTGKPVFRKCKYNTDESAQPLLGPQQFGDDHAAIPTMQRYALHFSSIASDSESLTLADAVVRQMRRLLFLASYLTEGSNDDDNGGSDPLVPTPNPLAS